MNARFFYFFHNFRIVLSIEVVMRMELNLFTMIVVQHCISQIIDRSMVFLKQQLNQLKNGQCFLISHAVSVSLNLIS